MNNTTQVQPPSTNDSNIIRFGLGVLFLLIIVFGGWSAFAPLAESAVAVGKISADLDKKTLQHLEGGVIDAILVKDGDHVEKGDLLLKLKDVNIRSQLNIYKVQYQDALALYARLQAQRDKAKNVEYPQELTNEDIKKEQNNIFYETKKGLEDEQNINQNRITQLNSQVDGLNSVIEAKKSRTDSISEEIKEWTELYKQHLVDKIKIRELTREHNALDGELAQTQSEVARLMENINEIKNQLQLREKEFAKETLQELVHTKSILFDLKSKIIAAQDTLERTNVIAPISGTIVGLNLHTVGGVVSPGKEILQIIPKDSELIVVAQVNTTDIDKVKVAMLADIRFSAFNLQQAHVIEGEVIHLSADSFVDEVSGMPYYQAKIRVTKNGEIQLAEYGFELVSGMPAEAMIHVSDRTVLSYLLKPFIDMVSRGFNEE